MYAIVPGVLMAAPLRKLVWYTVKPTGIITIALEEKPVLPLPTGTAIIIHRQTVPGSWLSLETHNRE